MKKFENDIERIVSSSSSEIDDIWEKSGHGTEREDVETAFKAGIKAALMYYSVNDSIKKHDD